MRTLEGQHLGQVTLRDVSDHGVYIASDTTDLPFRTRIWLQVMRPGRAPMVLTADLVHAMGPDVAANLGRPPGYGAELVDPPADVVEQLAAIAAGELLEEGQAAVGTREKLRAVGAPRRRPKPQRPVALIVDDDANVCYAISVALSAIGFTIVTAGTKRDAIDEFGEYQSRLRVAIVDYLLPDGDGLALIETFRGRDVKVALVAMSGVARTGAMYRALQAAGADRFVDKPFGIRELLRAVVEAVQERRVLDPQLQAILERAG